MTNRDSNPLSTSDFKALFSPSECANFSGVIYSSLTSSSWPDNNDDKDDNNNDNYNENDNSDNNNNNDNDNDNDNDNGNGNCINLDIDEVMKGTAYFPSHR